MEHKAYGAQPASVRHQGNPFSTKGLRLGPGYRPKIANVHKSRWPFMSHRGAQQLEARRKKDREQEILLFPVLHPSPVPQPLPHEQRRGPSASEKPSMSPALSSSPIKVFGKDGGSLRGEGKPFSKKVLPSPLIPELPPALPDLLETLGTARTGQVGPGACQSGAEIPEAPGAPQLGQLPGGAAVFGAGEDTPLGVFLAGG